MTRQVFLDTETTGLSPREHRLVELACVEVVDRTLTGKVFHEYLNPERVVGADAVNVHGLSSAFLANKPLFGQVAERFLDFVRGAEVVIHNAPFDLGFINHELALLDAVRGTSHGRLEDHAASITCSLKMARKAYPGQKNNLDALCTRLKIMNTRKDLHGARIDAETLVHVYFAMTRAQGNLGLGTTPIPEGVRPVPPRDQPLKIIRATPEEMDSHEKFMQDLSGLMGVDGRIVWTVSDMK